MLGHNRGEGVVVIVDGGEIDCGCCSIHFGTHRSVETVGPCVVSLSGREERHDGLPNACRDLSGPS